MTPRKLAPGCISAGALAGGLFASYYLLVGRSLPMPLIFVLILCTLATVFTLLAISSFRVAAARFGDARRMRHWESGEGKTEALIDGEKVMVFGPILPFGGQTVDSPFTRQRCVFYTYDIFRWVWRTGSDGNEHVKEHDYSGMRLIPSYVQTPSGTVRLLSVPTLKGFDAQAFEYSRETSEVFENAFRYIEGTSFRQFGKMSLTKVREAIDLVREATTDDDGSLRQDTQYSEEALDLRSRILVETILPEGAEVVLAGVWSAGKGGVVTDLSKGVVEVFRGNPQEAIGAVRTEGLKKILEGLLVFGAINLIVGVFWWITTQGPRHGSVTFSETVNEEVVREETLAPAMEEWPTDTPLAATATAEGPSAWVVYTNEAGNYRLEYPSGWSIEETLNGYPDLSSSGWSEVYLGDETTENRWVALLVSFEKAEGGCPDVGFEASYGEAPETLVKQVGDQNVRAFLSRFQKDSGQLLIQNMRFYRAGYCYTLALRDWVESPTQPELEHILETLAFLD